MNYVYIYTYILIFEYKINFNQNELFCAHPLIWCMTFLATSIELKVYLLIIYLAVRQTFHEHNIL